MLNSEYITNINDFNVQSALMLFFNDYNIIHLLCYFVNNYQNDKKNHKDLIEKYDFFMYRTLEDIKKYLCWTIDDKTIRKDINTLVQSGVLIHPENSSQYKIDYSKLQGLIECNLNDTRFNSHNINATVNIYDYNVQSSLMLSFNDYNIIHLLCYFVNNNQNSDSINTTLEDIKKYLYWDVNNKTLRKKINTLIQSGILIHTESTSQYKINISKLQEIIKSEQKHREEQLSNYKYKKSCVKRNRKAHFDRQMDFDKLNSIDTTSAKEIGKLDISQESMILIYLMSNYYRDYTGKKYEWNLVKYNSLMMSFRKYATYKGIEVGFALAIQAEINRKETTLRGKFPLEIRINDSFSHDKRSLDNLQKDTIFKNYLKHFSEEDMAELRKWQKPVKVNKEDSYYYSDKYQYERMSAFI